MKLYIDTKYKIARGITLYNNTIYDRRINEKISVDDPYSINIIGKILKSRSIMELVNSNIDNENIRLNMRLLYELDIICLESKYSKKIIYYKNPITMYIFSILLYFLRCIPVFLFFIINSLLGEKSLIVCIKTLLLVFTTIIVHELSHSLIHMYLSNFKNKFYIVIDKFSIYIVTRELLSYGKKIIALFGPLSGGVLSLIYYMIIKDNIYILITLYHLSMLLPFFEDGKHIWGINKN